MASGAVSAAQKVRSPLLVPKMKMDASGKSTSGSINRMTIPSPNGFDGSNPRTCLIAETAALIRPSLLLDLLAPHAVDDLGVGALPAAEELADGEGQLDARELPVGVVEGFVRDGAEVVLDERLLRLVAPEVLHEGVEQGPLVFGHVLVDEDGRVLTQDGGAREDDLEGR